MAQQLSPWLEGAYGWNFGEGGWNTGMDQNLLKFSFMFDRNVDSVVASLPSAVDGQAHYLTTDNRLYFAVGTTYFSTVVPKWFEFKDRSTGNTYQFNGTSAVQIDSPAQLDSRLDAVELTVASLGTAAFEDIAFFATASELDVAEAAAAAYTDSQITPLQTFDTDLSNNTDLTKGASPVHRATRHVNDVSKLVGLVGRYAGDEISTISYHPTWQNLLAGPVGGADFAWDSTRPKSQHNAGNIVSPTVPWDGTEGTFAAYIAKTGETDPDGNGCWVHRNTRTNEFNVLQWGAKNDATTNGANDAMIQPLLDYIEAPVGGGFGGVVNFPRGNYRFNNYFNVRDRTTLRGEGTSATILQFLGTTTIGNCITLGPTGPNHPLNPNGHWVFGVRLENLAVSGGNVYKGLNRALIYTDGAHEHSGLFNVVLRDFLNWGVHYNTGNGGPALFEVSDVEIYGADAAPTNGTKLGICCNAGGALVIVRHATITGGATHKLAQGIAMFKDNLVAQAVHFENASAGISLSQTDAANPRVNTIAGVTGNNTVGTGGLVDIASGFEGSVSAHALVNRGLVVTGLITLINRKTGESFTDQALGSYTFPSAISQGESISHGRISIAAGVASIIKQSGRAFTVSQTATGVTQITLSSAMPDSNYVVTPASRTSGGGASFVEFTPISTTVFEIRTRNAAGTLVDPASVWFSLEI